MRVKSISLRKKLLFGVFAISTLVTTISVGINFFYDYSKEIDQLHNTISSVESSILKPMSKLVWDFNETQIQTQLESVSKLPEVTSAKVTFLGSDKSFIAQDGKKTENDIIKVYDLNFSVSNETRKVGELEIIYDQQSVLNKIYDKLFLFIVIQFIKSFIISVLLIIFFQKIVTSRLENLTEHLEKLNSSQFKNINKIKKNKLPWLFRSRDEISELKRIVKKMSYKTKKYNESLTARVSEAETLAESERAKSIYSSKMATLGEMASGIAHEINNPLAVIQGRLGMMEKQNETLQGEAKEKYLTNISKILEMTKRISKIIKGLRNFARDGSDDPLEVTSFQAILLDANSLMMQRINSRQISYSFSSEDFMFSCRPVEISQVILNLINNSIDAIENLEEKWIKVEIVNHDTEACISITDSGSGIEKNIADKIMQPFFTTKEVGKGTGLGLSISKGIVEKIGGKLSVNYESKNTCFEIHLPKICDVTDKVS